MGKFIITRTPNGHYQFSLKAANGQVILASHGYVSKNGCCNGIDYLRNNCTCESRYHRKTSINGKYYFNLLVGDGEIIGTSELYESPSGRDNGIQTVKINALNATIEDRSSESVYTQHENNCDVSNGDGITHHKRVTGVVTE